jgi:hypothetical protein
MKKFAAAFGLLLACVAPSFACNAEKAVYHHLEEKDFSITFSQQKHPKSWSNILATLHLPSRKLDFEFTASNGYEILSMVLLTKGVKQERDIAISFLDRNLKSLQLPNAGEPAPEYLFTPELGLWLYYSGLEPQEYIPPGMWKLDRCQ